MATADNKSDEETESSRLFDEKQTETEIAADSSSSSQPDMTKEGEKCMAGVKDKLCGAESPVVKYAKEFCSVRNAKRKFPFVKWMPKYRVKHFVGDMVAGLTVGLTVIPQGLAYAVVAELPAQYGLYSAFMGCILYCFFGTSKDITLGPTAIMSLMVAEFASEKSPIHDDATYAIILTLFSGLIQLAMGFLHLGFVVQFISFPVISGFTSSAAIIIAFSQVRKWLGLKNVPRSFLPQVKETFAKLPETNLWDMTMGLCCMVVLVAMKKLKEFIDPKMKTETNKVKKGLYKLIWILCTARNAVVVIFTAVIASILVDTYGIKGEGTLTLTGNIEKGIPMPAIPKFSINHFDSHTNTTITRSTSEIFSDLGEGFIVVAVIGMLESIAIAKAFARRNEYQIDNNQELIALGVANAFSCFFHSFPVTGSFSRTAINSQSGVRTPAGGLWTAAVVILALAVLTPYFTYIPQAALAAVIICAVIQMVDYEVLPKLWKVKKLDLVPLFLTFFLCMLVNIEIGIMAGVAFSILILVYPMARPELKITYEKSIESMEEGDIAAPREAVVIQPNQGLKFPGVEYIKDKVMKHGPYEIPAKAVILNAQHFAGTDYSTVQGIMQLSEYFHNHKLKFVIAGASSEIRTILEAAEITNLQMVDSVEMALTIAFGDGSQMSDGASYQGKLNAGFTPEYGSASSDVDGDDVVSIEKPPIV